MNDLIDSLEAVSIDHPIISIIILAGMVALLLYCLKVIAVYFSNKYVLDRTDFFYEEHIGITAESHLLGKKLFDEYQTYCEYINDIGFDREHDCSNSVVSNARNNPVNYLIKYSDITSDEFYLDRIDFCLEFTNNLKALRNNFFELTKSIKDELPFFVRLFATKYKLPFWICNVNLSIHDYENPYFVFSYVSPAGRSAQEYFIDITPEILERIRGILYEKISRVGHRKVQRRAMTNDLREAIKQRDHYTCCKCGNSVYNEPNLLLEVDHIIPVSKGGKTEASNLQTLCWRCNRKKGNNI